VIEVTVSAGIPYPFSRTYHIDRSEGAAASQALKMFRKDVKEALQGQRKKLTEFDMKIPILKKGAATAAPTAPAGGMQVHSEGPVHEIQEDLLA